MTDILQNFLAQGLLDIGDDDTRLTKLRDAATDLQKRFTSEPRIALYHTLMLYSDNVEPEDECFRENAEILGQHWPTYKNRHPDVPITIFRGISLQALSAASQASPQLQIATAFALRSVAKIPYPNKQGPPLAEFYERSQLELEAKARAKWQAVGVTAPTPAKAVAVTAAQVDKATLENAIMAASGPNNLQNQAIPNANSVWPNSGQQWSQQFAPKMTEALVTALDSLAKTSAAETTKYIKGIGEQVASALSGAQQKWGEAMISNARRSELLWWRQSLYSPSLRRSYRDLQPAAAALVMASDFAELAGSCAPVSGDYFLRETVGYVLSSGKTVAQNEVLEQVTAERDVQERFLAAIPSLPPREGVKTVVEQLRDGILASPAKSKKSAGRATKSVQEDLTFLAVKVYAALQALKAAAEKSDGKKV
jgi:hypothetical protein